jgi:hypothetical protein
MRTLSDSKKKLAFDDGIQYFKKNGCPEGIMNDLIGKTVIVQTWDTLYAGRLVEIGEEEVHLESENGWIVVPVDRIASIREIES